MAQINTDLEILKTARDNMKTALEEKGQTVTKDIRTYAEAISNISTGGSGDVKLFETVEEMQQDENPQDGDLAVVYRSEMTIPSPRDTISSFSPPATVVFDTAITSSASLTIRNISARIELSCRLTASQFYISDIYRTVITDVSQITYTSSDGITYTRTDSGAESYDLSTEVTISSAANINILKFLLTNEAIFEGLYQYNTDQYAITKSQLDATADYVYGKTFYGKNGAEEGTLQQTTNLTNEQIKQRAEIYNKISNLSPIETDMTSCFANCTSFTIIPQLNTSNVTKMTSMFSNCKSLETIPLLDTSKITDMLNMFWGCSSLTSIPLLDTSNVTSMEYVFTNCTSLETVPLLDTSNVTDMLNMFSGCTSLTTIPLLNTSSVTNIAGMFNGCTNLTTIPQLNTGNVTNMTNTFSGCTSLSNTSLNNILAMCINATSYIGTKTLATIGLTSIQATTCQGLSNYQDFIDAGWTTGY